MIKPTTMRLIKLISVYFLNMSLTAITALSFHCAHLRPRAYPLESTPETKVLSLAGGEARKRKRAFPFEFAQSLSMIAECPEKAKHLNGYWFNGVYHDNPRSSLERRAVQSHKRTL